MEAAPAVPAKRRRLGVLGRGLWSSATLPALLGDAELVRVRGRLPLSLDGVLAWGRRPSALRAEALARLHGLPVVTVEDGFLRSVSLGPDSPPLSIVVDDQGIYFDARSPSRLETLIASGIDAGEACRAGNLRTAWCQARVSKYNHAREDALSGELPARYVLVVDQTFGDASISGGLADASSFSRMLAAAISRHPDCTILLKVHPDVVSGRKRGHFDLQKLSHEKRIRIVADAVHPVLLIENAEAVYAVTSQLGFEALLHGKPVHVFGMPFYAGWGLTNDALPAPSRRRAAPLLTLVHAALVSYPRYIDPETGLRCEVERLVEWMALQLTTRARFPAHLDAYRFSPWKAATLRRFMPGSKLRFHWLSRAHSSPAAPVVVWGRKHYDDLVRAGGCLTVEDGFLRSVGLGAELVKPLSWVIDDVGIYYDASRPSRLECLLQEGEFDQKLCNRAAELRAGIRSAGLTKYNLTGPVWQRPTQAAHVILVPGQVESDASITWGAPLIRRNIDLLRAVREENPDAWIVYKPHPDVVAGVRRPGDGEAGVAELCNEVVVAASMHQLLDAVDEVHVLTSLAGFEALLREKPVTCWGQPFYAGWGLSVDRAPLARRTRRRSLDELVAAVLILYPVYISRVSGAYTTAERTRTELAAWNAVSVGRPSVWTSLKRAVMRFRSIVHG